MAYIGNQNPTGFVGRLPKQDLTGATGGTLALSNPVSSSHDIELFINHVRQEPETSYQAAGTVVTLQGYTVSATDDIYVNYKGLAQLTSTVDDGSIGANKIANGSITSAKLSSTDTFAFAAGLKLGSGTDTLSVYDEGTFTPTMSASSGSITTQSNTGQYIRIGNICFVYMVLTLTNKGNASGSLNLDGLPFPTTTSRISMLCRENANSGHMEQFVVNSAPNTSGFFKARGGGQVTMQNNDVRLVSGFYIVG